MSMEFDRATGMARAGGLAGHGLVASSLCGRTLADLIRERDRELTSLPWVGHRSGAWEIEPARMVAQRAIMAVLASAIASKMRGAAQPAGRAWSGASPQVGERDADAARGAAWPPRGGGTDGAWAPLDLVWLSQ